MTEKGAYTNLRSKEKQEVKMVTIQDQRNTGIGATDAAVVLGHSPWRTPLDLYLEKTGQKDDFHPSERMEWGILLEPVIAKEYCERTDRKFVQMGNRFRRHPEKEFMIAHLDRVIEDTDRGTGLLEIKTTSAFNKKDWEIEPPVYYQIQLQHQLAITGHDWGAIVVLIGGQELVYQDMPRNDRLIEHLEDEEAAFWRNVQDRRPPAVDYERDTENLKKLHEAKRNSTIELPADAHQWKREIDSAAQVVKQQKAHQQRYRNMIIDHLHGCDSGVIPGGGTVTYKPITRRGYTSKDTTYQQLNFQKGGKR